MADRRPQTGAEVPGVSDVLKLEISDLIREQQLGELSFKSAELTIYSILDIIRRFSRLELKYVPRETVDGFTNLIRELSDLFNRMIKFNSTQANASGVNKTIISEAERLLKKYYAELLPIIVFESVRDSGLPESILAASETANTKLEETEKRASKILEDMEAAAAKVRRAAEEVGVKRHTKLFFEEAERCRKESIVWLISVLVIAAAIIGFAWYYLGQAFSVAGGESPTALLQVATPRIIIISLLSIGLFFCMRHYSATRHNVTINRHRQNALGSFETFVAATEDLQTRDAVLLQATQSIFAPQPTGYLKADGDIQQPTNVIEVIRRMANGEK